VLNVLLYGLAIWLEVGGVYQLITGRSAGIGRYFGLPNSASVNRTFGAAGVIFGFLMVFIAVHAPQ